MQVEQKQEKVKPISNNEMSCHYETNYYYRNKMCHNEIHPNYT